MPNLPPLLADAYLIPVILAAMLMLPPASRFVGVMLGCCVMIAAIAAVLVHRRYRHLPPPILFLLLLALVGAA